MKDYCVYCHTNKKDGKRYIGITCQKPENRWRKGDGYRNNPYFSRAIKKFGWEGFVHEILYTDLSKEDAEKIEIRLIAKYKTTNNSYGYNIENGGNGTEKFTKELKEKLSKAQMNHICSEETKRKISESKKGVPSKKKGVKMTPEQIEKNRISHLGQKAWNKGRPWSDEEKAKCGGIPVVNLKTNITYRTIHEASRKTNQGYAKIRNHCHNLVKKPEWQFAMQVTAEEVATLPV